MLSPTVVRGSPSTSAYGVLDSRAFAYLKMGKFHEAADAYSQALIENRDSASSYYGRGLAKQENDDKSDGEHDIPTAEHIDPDIEKHFGK
jgi:tetratricopeptide (TPR) repeat protein